MQIDQSSFQAITPELSWKTESSQSTSFAISWVGFMMWVLNSEKAKVNGVSLFNMSMNPGPSIEEYVNSIARIAKIKVWIPNVPSSLLFIIAYSIDLIAKPLGIKHPFSPVRIRKLIRSNNILPTYLVENGYDYKYTLDEAFADWKKDCPEEWH